MIEPTIFPGSAHATSDTTENGTGTLAIWASTLNREQIDHDVVAGAKQLLANIIGCMIGGSRHGVVASTVNGLAEFFGPPQATLVGTALRMDVLNAAFLNALAASAHAFDDTHAMAIVHPSTPVAGALLPLTERSKVNGEELLTAFVVGVEVTCRVASALSVAPAECKVAWMLTGVAGAIGAAAAASRLLRLDAAKTGSALGLASSFASGVRSLHGTMGIPLTPANASRAGLQAALLAAAGIECEKATLEAPLGLLSAFAEKPHFAALTEDLGTRFELSKTEIKPYPCGVVIHPVIDACLNLYRRGNLRIEMVKRVKVEVHPTGFKLGSRQASDAYGARTSIPYWVMATLSTGRADISVLNRPSSDQLWSTQVQSLVELSAVESMGPDSARVTCETLDGRAVDSFVLHALGSKARPMTESDIRSKFAGLCDDVIGRDRTEALLAACWGVDRLGDASVLVPDVRRSI